MTRLTLFALLAFALTWCREPQGRSAQSSTQNPSLTTRPSSDADSLVKVALAFERAGRGDSARSTYRATGESLPLVRDWMLLRAAALTPAASERRGLYTRIHGRAARARVGWVEAGALEEFRDSVAAAEAYERLGAHARALRARLGATAAGGERNNIRMRLVQLLGKDAGSDERRIAIDALDHGFPALSPGEELMVARAASQSGPLARAATAYGRAFAAGQGTVDDRYDYGIVLQRLRRDPEAAGQFAQIASGPLAPRAALQRARSLMRQGPAASTRSLLASVSTRYASDTAVAPQALFLLADLLADTDHAEARRILAKLVRGYPTHALAPSALYQEALLALTDRAWRTAALEYDSLVRAFSASDEVSGALYWAGRAYDASGDRAAARRRWQDLLARNPASYYTMLAIQRLAARPWQVPAGPEEAAAPDSVIAAARRVAWLQRVGLQQEAGYELGQLENDADSSTDRLLTSARALRDAGAPAQAIAFVRKAIAPGTAFDGGVYAVLYPLPFRDLIRNEARAAGLDPALLTAVIRQESRFDPRAVSSASAVGLMQVMPNVGRSLAASRGISPWTPDRLTEPEVNVKLGVVHFASSIRKYGDLPRALAAYNAGDSRVARWSRLPGAADREIFVELIPYAETRDYVRAILRDREIYRAMGADRMAR